MKADSSYHLIIGRIESNYDSYLKRRITTTKEICVLLLCMILLSDFIPIALNAIFQIRLH